MALSPSDSILRGPLLRLVRGGPLQAHSPKSRHEFVTKGNGPSGRGCNATTILFRPRGFAPPRRFSPHRGVRACCVPVPDMGFAAFLDRQATSTEVLAAGGRATPFPKERGTTRILAALTLRRFESRRQPLRIAAVVASTPFVPSLFPPRTTGKSGRRFRRAPGGRGLTAVPSGCSASVGRRLPFLSPTRCRGCRTPRDPPGITQDWTTSARRPRTCRMLPHGSRRSTSRPCSTDESVTTALVSEKPRHVPSMGFDPPRGHARTRWFPRSPASPIPPTWHGRSHTGMVSVRGGCRSDCSLPTSGGF
jgi:hypothetical protein